MEEHAWITVLPVDLASAFDDIFLVFEVGVWSCITNLPMASPTFQKESRQLLGFGLACQGSWHANTFTSEREILKVRSAKDQIIGTWRQQPG